MRSAYTSLLLLAAAAVRAGILPDAYVVELESADALGKRSSPHQDLYDSLDALGYEYTVRSEYNDATLFVGAALNLHNAGGMPSSLPGVKAVHPIRTYARPNPTVVAADDPSYPTDYETTHIMTGVDKLHEEGYFGANIKIGIIDTGTDYTNPWLGGCFGYGCKVALGTDFVGDDYNGTNTPVPDPDPLDQCAGHGTHVAGIIGANPGNQYNVSGVAYKAVLGSYRVFGCTGSTTDDVIIEALMLAFNDSCDIMTLSLGGVDPWTESVSAVVASRIVDAGRIVTIAAGNDGGYGAWYASSPGTGVDVIAVASVDNTVIPLQNLTVSSGYGPVPYYAAIPAYIYGPHPLYATSLNTSITDDACDPLPASTPDLSNYVVLIKRGTCTFVTKLGNAAAFGAQNFLIYDNLVQPLSGISVGNYTNNAFLITNVDGVNLVHQLAAGANLSVTFPQSGAQFLEPATTGGLISSFSTYGPTQDMYFKPAVAAPGGNIFSTYPVDMGTWTVLSGTSMATPFVAGSAALLLEAHGRTAYTSVTAKTLFETTAMVVPESYNASSPLQTVAWQGAGLINVYNAVHYGTTLMPGELLLNDTTHFVGEHQITVTNTGASEMTYTLTHIPAGTAPTYEDLFPLDGPLALGGATASVHISDTAFSLAPKSSKNITLTFTPPQGLNESAVPVYSGFIQVASESGETLHATYLGVAASLYDVQVLDNTDAYFGFTIPAIVDVDGYQLNYTDPTMYFTLTPDDQPTLYFRLLFGTPAFRIDLIAASENFGAKRQVAGGGSFDTIPILGVIQEGDYQPRNSDASDYADNGYNMLQWNGTFANGSYAANGQYKMLLRALKTTGDPSVEDDYETWLSPIFGVDMGT